MKFVLDNEKESTKHSQVTASVFLAVRKEDNKLIGIINIRHALNDYLFNFGGHIGYTVKKMNAEKVMQRKCLKCHFRNAESLVAGSFLPGPLSQVPYNIYVKIS